MELSTNFIEGLTKILHSTAKTLEKSLKDLLIEQNSLSQDHVISLIPSEIISDPRYLNLELNGGISSYSNTILELLGEWQSIRIGKKFDVIKSNLSQVNLSSNFSPKISRRILGDILQKHRLLVLAAPFKISPSCVAGLRENLEIELNEDLKAFLSINYPYDSKESPIEFYSDFFRHNINDNDVHELQSILTYIPTLILHSSISDYKAYFHINLWLPNNDTIISCTLPAWQWEEACETLEISGKQKHEALRIIRQAIISIQELLAAFVADWYYLHLNSNYLPKLLQSNNILTSQYFDVALINPYLDILKTTQIEQKSIKRNVLEKLYSKQKNIDKKLKEKIREWYLSSIFTSHSGSVHSLTFNTDHSILISGGSDSIVRLWHPSTGKVSLSLKGHIGDIFAVAISDNNKYFASSGSDCKVIVWNLDKLQEPICFREHSAYVSSLAFCPDNRLLASGSYDNTIRIWDMWSSKELRVLNEHSSYVTSIAFNVKGDLLASGSYDCSIRIWNPWEEVSKLTLTGHSDYVTCVAFSPSDNLIASGSRDRTIKLWQIDTGKLIATLKGNGATVNSLTFSPDGEILASGSSDCTIRLWSTRTAEELGILTVGAHPILCVHFSKDGKQLAMGSSWTDNIKIWNCH